MREGGPRLKSLSEGWETEDSGGRLSCMLFAD